MRDLSQEEFNNKAFSPKKIILDTWKKIEDLKNR